MRIHGTAERAEYAESLPIQWIVDWGVVVGGAILVALAGAWLSAARNARGPARIGAVAAIASITVHDLMDFALEELGPALAELRRSASSKARIARPELPRVRSRSPRRTSWARWGRAQ